MSTSNTQSSTLLAGLIGEGLHRRAIIDLQRFEQRLAAKTAGRAAPQETRPRGAQR
jgi:hypothetical protein